MTLVEVAATRMSFQWETKANFISMISSIEPNKSFNSGPWSSEEEARFLEGLELYGRDWPALQKHMQTRDSPSIRSRAQRHFIKLFRDGKPLPAKVLERFLLILRFSGAGFTLSGKLLDPNSAAARGYLKKMGPWMCKPEDLSPEDFVIQATVVRKLKSPTKRVKQDEFKVAAFKAPPSRSDRPKRQRNAVSYESGVDNPHSLIHLEGKRRVYFKLTRINHLP